MRGMLVAAVLLAALLAGCGQKAPVQDTATVATDRMRIGGLVEADTLVPLGNATVRLVEANLTAQTDGLGAFQFPPVAPRVYTVEARLAGYGTGILIARPETNSGSLDFVLQRFVGKAPRQEQFHFRGSMDCGAEAFIIASSCDGGTGTLGNQTRFDFILAAGWNTTVADVVFDPSVNPGLDGLRLTVRGQGQSSQLNSYQQYGRFHNSTSFTARLDPGVTYQDATLPVDANITAFLMDVYPQGQLYHRACVPNTPAHPAECALGVGAGVNIQFDLYVTVFYGTPAPAGFTMRTNG